MSIFAFGTYKVTSIDQNHISALKLALENGIDKIVTSSKYSNSLALEAVAKSIEFVDNNSLEIIVKSISSLETSELKEDIDFVLKSLKKDRLDCYLLDGFEIYLNDFKEKDNAIDIIYEKLFNAFVFLEKEVKDGTIKSYGVSSEAFSKTNDESLPYEDILILARNAAIKVGANDHSLTTISLPINLLEQDGLKCASWAKKNSLRVISTRALNAKLDNAMFRLASYDEPKEYYYYLNELLEICDNDELRSLYNLIEQLDATKHKYGWIGDYELFLVNQILPHIQKTIQNLDEKIVDELLVYIDRFLQEYKAMVAYECYKTTKVLLKDYLKDCQSRLQECAIDFLKSQENIDIIEIGMRKPSYVSDILDI